jgi:N-acetylglucosamine-6-phosphate deacetylase
MHGGGGHDVGASIDALLAAVAFHRRHGTTSTLVSLVTAPVLLLERQLGGIADAAAKDSGIIGAHLEGPFLSATRCGAQAPRHLIAPDRVAFDRFVTAAGGCLRCVTYAPELPNAASLAAAVLEAGAVLAVGHTDATYEQARTAFDAGATLTTHLFNGMRPIHHREPGAALAALDSGAGCEVINDGVHVHPAMVALAARSSRLALVTDAMDATGVGDGDYLLGGQAVRVSGGQARLRGSGSLAGSTLTMDEAVRRAVLEVGLTVPHASACASANPAALLGLSDVVGAIVAGLTADLVVLDDDLRLCGVMARGEWVRRPV